MTYLVVVWAFAVFLSVADCKLSYDFQLIRLDENPATTVMMILRVYAMWNRSRRILHFLLFFWTVQTITGVVFAGLYINPATYLSGMMS